MATFRLASLALPAILLVLSIGAVGCRSRAHTDLYIDEMSSEIRVLEDQLYDCDYENRVLLSKYERAQAKLEALREGKTPPRDEVDRNDVEDEEDDIDDPLSPSDVELGEPAPPDLDINIPIPPDVAPQSAVPGKKDKKNAEFVLGPLPSEEDEPEEIQLPPGTHRLFAQPVGPPAQLRVDSLRSHGKTSSDAAGFEHVRLVVTVNDASGRATDCADTLSIALLDPARNGPAARLGVWTFAPEQLKQAAAPQKGEYHLELTLDEVQPQGDTLECFVRIERGEDQEQGPQTNATIQLHRTPQEIAKASWLPRG